MIDMDRWNLAFSEIRELVTQIEQFPGAQLPNTWAWIRQNYAASLATYSMMTPDQQTTVKEPLEALRVRLEKLSH